jgi:hypothetical protein
LENLYHCRGEGMLPLVEVGPLTHAESSTKDETHIDLVDRLWPF